MAWLTAALAAAGTFGLTSVAQASSHREAPAISEDPTADNTDLWAFMVNPGQDNAALTIVAAYNPLEEPSGGPNFNKFSDDVLYEVHVTRGDGILNEVVTYQIEFNTSKIQKVDVADLNLPLGGGKEFFAQLSGQQQTYTVREVVGNKSTVIAKDVPVAPPNIGPRTNAVALQIGTSNDDYEAFAAGPNFIKGLNKGGFVWAGPRDDGFYVDLGATFDLANFRQLLDDPQPGVDGVKGFNCHAIALEIPVKNIPAAKNNKDPKNADLVGVYASASRRKISILRNDGTRLDLGPFVQVSRLGLPLVNEVVIGLQDKDKWNRSDPKDEVKLFGAYFLNPVIVRDAEAVGIYEKLGVDPTPFKSNRVDILKAINLDALGHTIPIEPGKTGDVLRVDLNLPSGFPNGRSIPGGAQPNQEQADVTDVLASLFLTGNPAAGVGDAIGNNDANYRTSFPWLARPWRGFEEGHGNFAGPGLRRRLSDRTQARYQEPPPPPEAYPDRDHEPPSATARPRRPGATGACPRAAPRRARRGDRRPRPLCLRQGPPAHRDPRGPRGPRPQVGPPLARLARARPAGRQGGGRPSRRTVRKAPQGAARPARHLGAARPRLGAQGARVGRPRLLRPRRRVRRPRARPRARQRARARAAGAGQAERAQVRRGPRRRRADFGKVP